MNETLNPIRQNLSESSETVLFFSLTGMTISSHCLPYVTLGNMIFVFITLVIAIIGTIMIIHLRRQLYEAEAIKSNPEKFQYTGRKLSGSAWDPVVSVSPEPPSIESDDDSNDEDSDDSEDSDYTESEVFSREVTQAVVEPTPNSRGVSAVSNTHSVIMPSAPPVNTHM